MENCSRIQRNLWNDWDWDAGLVASKASSEMDNHGRQSMTLLNEALADSTPNAYNPFSAGVGSNEEAFYSKHISETIILIYIWQI